MGNKKFGSIGETLAVTYLENNNFEVLNRNFRKKYGEIDIIALRCGILHFIEVKTRATDKFGRPVESVDRKKRAKIFKVAQAYVKENNQAYESFRFDVIEISLNHIEGGF
ncbi:MAG: YraN family protein [Eubacterium sp.]|nr:YraN family protein [Eubacterium sp.]